MRQLAIQFPESNDEYKRVAEEWDSRVANQQGESGGAGQVLAANIPNLPSQDYRSTLRLTDRQQYMSDFVKS